MTNDSIRQMIREMINEEIERELDEVSTSAATPGYMTPNAFAGPGASGKAKMKKNSEQAGYKLVGEGTDDDRIDEGRSHYANYKADTSATPKQKIGRALAEVSRTLDTLDKAIRINHRLKSEENLGSGQLWKRTNNALMKIESRLMGMVRRIQELKG
jgi:hypothetical protein